MYVCVYVCVLVCEREGSGERAGDRYPSLHIHTHAPHMHTNHRGRERESARDVHFTKYIYTHTLSHTLHSTQTIHRERKRRIHTHTRHSALDTLHYTLYYMQHNPLQMLQTLHTALTTHNPPRTISVSARTCARSEASLSTRSACKRRRRASSSSSRSRTTALRWLECCRAFSSLRRRISRAWDSSSWVRCRASSSDRSSC